MKKYKLRCRKVKTTNVLNNRAIIYSELHLQVSTILNLKVSNIKVSDDKSYYDSINHYFVTKFTWVLFYVRNT